MTDFLGVLVPVVIFVTLFLTTLTLNAIVMYGLWAAIIFSPIIVFLLWSLFKLFSLFSVNARFK